MRKTMMLVGLAAVMTSCVNQGPTYLEPAPDPARTATLETGHRSDGLLNNTAFLVDRINGVPFRFKTKYSKGGLSHTIPAGKSVLSLFMSHISTTFVYGQMEARADIKVNLKSGITYEGYGEIHHRDKVTFWLQEKGSKKRVSEVITMNPQKFAPTPVTVFIP